MADEHASPWPRIAQLPVPTFLVGIFVVTSEGAEIVYAVSVGSDCAGLPSPWSQLCEPGATSWFRSSRAWTSSAELTLLCQSHHRPSALAGLTPPGSGYVALGRDARPGTRGWSDHLRSEGALHTPEQVWRRDAVRTSPLESQFAVELAALHATPAEARWFRRKQSGAVTPFDDGHGPFVPIPGDRVSFRAIPHLTVGVTWQMRAAPLDQSEPPRGTRGC